MNTTGQSFDAHPTIEQAYAELSQEAFAVWIRMMVMDPDDLLKGRGFIAKLLGYSQGRSDVILRELRAMGYLGLERASTPGEVSKFTILRRAVIVGRNQFIKAAGIESAERAPHAASTRQSGTTVELQYGHQSLQYGHQSCEPEARGVMARKHLATIAAFNWMGHDFSDVEDDLGHPLQAPPTDCDSEAAQLYFQSLTQYQEWLAGRAEDGLVDSKKVRKDNLDPSKRTPSNQKRHLALSRFTENRDKAKQERSERAKKGRRFPKGNGVLDVNALKDAEDKPASSSIRFAPPQNLREKYLEILQRKQSDGSRRKLVEKLGVEFRRIYSRYRRQYHVSYLSGPEDEAHARNAAVQCITKGVTPSKLIEYWHKNVGRFTSMRFPSLAFLSRASNIDEVACSNIGPAPERKAAARVALKPASTHAFDNAHLLDPRLRPGLTEAGFVLDKWSDRELMTIQSTAKSIAQGYKIFISSKMKPMVEWAAQNLFLGGGDAK